MTPRNGKPCARCGTSEWYAHGDCKYCTRQKAIQWQKENAEQVNAKNRKWRADNYARICEKMRSKIRDWRKNNPDKQYEACRRWNQAHPESAAVYINRRRAKKRNSGGSYTRKEWIDLCEKYGNRCLCCGKGNVKLTQDHVVPLDLGGCNTIDNIQPLCKSCNSSKRTKIIDYRVGA